MARSVTYGLTAVLAGTRWKINAKQYHAGRLLSLRLIEQDKDGLPRLINTRSGKYYELHIEKVARAVWKVTLHTMQMVRKITANGLVEKEVAKKVLCTHKPITDILTTVQNYIKG